MNAPENLKDRPLTIAGRAYDSRLLVGTGKYKDFEQTRRAIEASGAQIVTVALRRTNLGQDKSQPNLLDVLPPSRKAVSLCRLRGTMSWLSSTATRRPVSSRRASRSAMVWPSASS